MLTILMDGCGEVARGPQDEPNVRHGFIFEVHNHLLLCIWLSILIFKHNLTLVEIKINLHQKRHSK
jgi:hypothetical protein